VKGESIKWDHMLPCCKCTKSGIAVFRWIKMVIAAHGMAGCTGGPAITDWNGTILSLSVLDDRLGESLEQLFHEGVVFPLKIQLIEDIRERFSVFISLRRASNTRAINMKVDSNDIDIVNCWKAVEEARGKKPSRPMWQYYAEVGALVSPFLIYTLEM